MGFIAEHPAVAVSIMNMFCDFFNLWVAHGNLKLAKENRRRHLQLVERNK